MRKGLWVGLLPTLFQLFFVFPYRTAYGPMGMGLGTLTPLFVLLFNFIWGFITGTFARALWGGDEVFLLSFPDAALICPAPSASGRSAPGRRKLRGRVHWIYDGDTLKVAGVGKVRLLGIDAPEHEDSPRDRYYLRQGIPRKRLRRIARKALRFNIETVKGPGGPASSTATKGTATAVCSPMSFFPTAEC